MSENFGETDKEKFGFSKGKILDEGRYKGFSAKIIREDEPDRVLVKVVFNEGTKYGGLPGEFFSFSSNDERLEAKIAGAIEKIKKNPNWKMVN